LDNKPKLSLQSGGVAVLPHEIQTLFSRAILDRAAWLFSGEGFCAGRKHWLEYDVAALVLLIVGMAAVGLLALMI
jgi:hypothetical protein